LEAFLASFRSLPALTGCLAGLDLTALAGLLFGFDFVFTALAMILSSFNQIAREPAQCRADEHPLTEPESTQV
jgi:hypothetical protein